MKKRWIIFSVSLVIVILLVLIIIPKDSPNSQNFNEPQEQFRGLNENCEGTKVIFEYPPVNLEKTKVLVPFGLMTGNHVTPVDHQYFQNFDNDEANIEVYSPGKGTITNMQHMTGSYFDSRNNKEVQWSDYRLEIQHTCTISSIYIHIDKLSDKLAAAAPINNEFLMVNLEVEAGEIIGRYSQNVDYNLVDTEVTLEGFVVPEHYKGEPWKIHVPSTTEYFTEEIKNKIADLSFLTENPDGKFDHDIDGKLIGNWFVEGTNGYAGDNWENYWTTHLSISPDYLDSTHIIVSMGDFKGEPKQFAVKGNSPNPAEVTQDSGLVKYELVHYEYFAGEEVWNRLTLTKDLKAVNQDDYVIGVILLELQEDRVLKVEIFPDKTGSEVSGFTENSRLYER